MQTIRRSLEIGAPVDVVADAWDRFVQGVLTGSRRLACDALACVSAVDNGTVSFDDVAPDRTRVEVAVQMPDDLCDESCVTSQRELLEHKAAHDLVMFWDYVETGEHLREHVTLEVGTAMVDDEARRTHHSARGDRVPDMDAFSHRRTFRA